MSFAPDGKHFVAYDGEAKGLVIVDLDLQTSTLLTAVSGDFAWPAWSVDGSRIVYGDLVGDQKTSWGAPNVDLFVIRVDPSTGARLGEPVNITHSPDTIELAADWSRHGDRLSVRASTSATARELLVLTLASDRTAVVSSESLTGVIGSAPFASGRPQWMRSSSSPDTIVFAQQGDGKFDLRYVEVDSKRVGLVPTASSVELWALSSDGEQVAVVESDGKTRSVSVITNLRSVVVGGANPESADTPLRTGSKEMHWFEEISWRP